MIGLDTNVLLRLGDEKEPAQRARAVALVASQGPSGCFVDTIVLCEYVWSLRTGFKMERGAIADRLEAICATSEILLSRFREVQLALAKFRAGPADFSDYLIAEINSAEGCSSTATFDGDALKSGAPFSPVPTLS
jgi:predicted nucleic-acid-binding protein